MWFYFMVDIDHEIINIKIIFVNFYCLVNRKNRNKCIKDYKLFSHFQIDKINEKTITKKYYNHSHNISPFGSRWNHTTEKPDAVVAIILSCRHN